MTTTMINFRIDKNLKDEMEEICKSMGLTLTVAFNVFARKLVMERCMPFEITADSFYSDENIKELKKRINNVKTGKSRLKEHKLIEK